MNALISPLLKIDEYNDLISKLKNNTGCLGVIGPSDSQKAHLLYALSKHANKKIVIIAYNHLSACKLHQDLSFFLGQRTLLFEPREIMLYDVYAKSKDEEIQRLTTLNKIVKEDYDILVTSIEAMNIKLPLKSKFLENIFEIKLGQSYEMAELIQKLNILGYERVLEIEGKGQFAVRGGIIDVFPIHLEMPNRIEFFDTEVDSIREFDILNHRSLENVNSVEIIPAKEVFYAPKEKQKIINLILEDFKSLENKSINKKDTYVKLKEKVHKDIESLENEYYFGGIDRLIPYIYQENSHFTDYINQTNVIVIDEPVRMLQSIRNSQDQLEDSLKNMILSGHLMPSCYNAFFNEVDLLRKLENRNIILSSSFNIKTDKIMASEEFNITYKPSGGYNGILTLLYEDLKNWKSKGKKIVILSGVKARGERLVSLLQDNEIEAVYNDDLSREILDGQIMITHGSLASGFEYPQADLIIVSEKDLFGADKEFKRRKIKKKGKKIDVFTDLKQGDYVVHEVHGIGKYIGIEQLIVEATTRDYFKINYLDGGNLYIPTEQLDLLQKYIGTEGKTPKLNKLGGAEWRRTTAKVKESLKELAVELIKLYAEREMAKGHQFSPDTVWQTQMEDTFPYEETEDQLVCTAEIKKDMESERPMDRLLCGDVGFGKTEVALRALFKAVMDGKQVAYLVPTTVLAQQQYNNFRERLKDFPISIELLSRFKTKVEQSKTLKDAKNGLVDVVVGTHRLIQKDVQFKNLGLLIVDEEQRFGVTHKESLKSLKKNVDVLSLSATPIPRTLHMSLVGIKDISILEDPPSNRHPVQTYVMEYSPSVVRDAVEREMARNGQVFYLYNNVKAIELKEAEISALIPDARIAVAHGQMAEGQLEKVMMEFMNAEYDVLICSTIIESGLDMPNVNTIIVEESDKMGLAQLYQIKGRVGRSNRVAYAYITYKKDKILTEVAEKRLRAIREFTELGSGFKIAMRDLEIRGAGNLLGPQQHGQMETVGYEMYCKLLEDAVSDLKGEGVESSEEYASIKIDIKVDAYINFSYIEDEEQKIDMYKKIANISNDEDLEDIRDELIDRYGDVPIEVLNLMDIAYIKNLAKVLKFNQVIWKDEGVFLHYSNSKALDINIIRKLLETYKSKILVSASSKPYLTYKCGKMKKDEILRNIKILLQTLKKLYNNPQ